MNDVTARFEVGKEYRAMDSGFSNLLVVKRTAKSIKVKNSDGNTWMMRIRVDDDGVEWVHDSAAGKKWIDAFTYRASWVVEEGR